MSMQQRLKSMPGTAGARVIATKFLKQLLGATYNSFAAFDARLGREAFATLAKHSVLNNAA